MTKIETIEALALAADVVTTHYCLDVNVVYVYGTLDAIERFTIELFKAYPSDVGRIEYFDDKRARIQFAGMFEYEE